MRLDCRPASEVLPELDWRTKIIVWLDYDQKLNESVLSDATTVCVKASSGSLLAVSVNVHVERDPDETTRQEYIAETGLAFNIDEYRLREFRKRVGDRLPPEVKGDDLRGNGLAKWSRKVIHSMIEEALSIRNGLVQAEKKLLYRQIFNFHYSDGAPILTVGGVFLEEGDQQKFDACSFSELDFLRFGDEPYVIKVPCLTMKEMRHLNAQIPKSTGAALTVPGVPLSDIQQYAELYRYFPTFAEAIFT